MGASAVGRYRRTTGTNLGTVRRVALSLLKRADT
jgi:hypothetical protein